MNSIEYAYGLVEKDHNNYLKLDDHCKKNVKIILEYINPDKGRLKNLYLLPYNIRCIIPDEEYEKLYKDYLGEIFNYLPYRLHTSELSKRAFYQRNSLLCVMMKEYIDYDMVDTFLKKATNIEACTISCKFKHFVTPNMLHDVIYSLYNEEIYCPDLNYLDYDPYLDGIKNVLSTYSIDKIYQLKNRLEEILSHKQKLNNIFLEFANESSNKRIKIY
jgi:hypothetical protein